MTLNNVFFPENPFINIKVRHILICFFLAATGLIIQIFVSASIIGIDPKNLDLDPIVEIILESIAITLTITWTLRQLQLAQINLKQIIGKLFIPYPWILILGIVVARILFSIGIFRVLYYPLSFMFPAWVENAITYSYNYWGDAAKSFSPVLYYLLKSLDLIIVQPIFDIFILEGIALHRWSARWGTIPAIIIISLIYSTNYNFLGGFSLGLMQTVLYIKSKTILVPVVARIINNAIGILISFFIFSVENPLEKFRSQLGLGVFCLALSTPLLIWLLYKNRIRSNELLPYFANAKSLVDECKETE